MTGFYFDAPTSAQSTAYDKSHRKQPIDPASALPSQKSRRSSINTLTSYFKKPFHRSASSSASVPRISTPAAASLFFRLPIALREQIYGYVTGYNEVLHVLLREKRRPARHYTVGYRRCKIRGSLLDCAYAGCKQFHDCVKGVYYGPFDRIGGLLLSCRDM